MSNAVCAVDITECLFTEIHIIRLRGWSQMEGWYNSRKGIKDKCK